jgi:hypothetical protein
MTALRADAADYRKTREARFDKPIEEVVAGRDKSVEDFRRALADAATAGSTSMNALWLKPPGSQARSAR